MRTQGGKTALWLTHCFAKGNQTGHRESAGSGRRRAGITGRAASRDPGSLSLGTVAGGAARSLCSRNPSRLGAAKWSRRSSVRERCSYGLTTSL